MSRAAFALLISVVVAGNVVIIAVLLGGRDSGRGSGAPSLDDGDASVASVVEAIEALRGDLDRLSARMAGSPTAAAATGAPVTGEGGAGAASGVLAARLDEVIERLDGLDAALAAMKDVKEELAAAKLRKEREEQFRSEEGYALADELLAQEKFAMGANGILTFLDAHPDHPDARDLMRKARDAFFRAGYGEKALWLQDEIMTKFPEHRGADLYSLALLENQMRKREDAIGHMNESVELATTDRDRMNRMFFRAYLLHQRDGDQVGLAAYREVERLARAAGITNPADEAKKRADEIEQRLAAR